MTHDEELMEKAIKNANLLLEMQTLEDLQQFYFCRVVDELYQSEITVRRHYYVK